VSSYSAEFNSIIAYAINFRGVLVDFVGKLLILLSIVCVPFFGKFSSAREGPPEIIAKRCKTELKSFCKDVTPGGGRSLACIFAHNDKLSGRCEYALFQGSAQLERFVSLLTYVATECKDDLKKYCADVKPGQGHLLDCIHKNEDLLSPGCLEALRTVKHE
jgi:hypothetical protein